MGDWTPDCTQNTSWLPAVGTTRASTQEQTVTEDKTRTKTAPPWNIIVHDDPVTLMNYVTKVFMDVFAYPESKAQLLMREVHDAGRSVVWTGAREQAEVYASKLVSFHLLTTVEPGVGSD